MIAAFRNPVPTIIILLITLVTPSISVMASGGSVIIVESGDSIQAAINIAENGTRIEVLPGTYAGFDYSGKSLHVVGIGEAESIIIDGKSSPKTVVFENGEGPGSILENFTIRDADSGNVLSCGTLGGAVHISGSSPIIRDCVFKNNTGSRGGSAIQSSNGSGPLIEGCVFEQNSGENVIYDICESSSRIHNCLFMDNSTQQCYMNHLASDAGDRSNEIFNCDFVNNWCSQELLMWWGGEVSPIVSHCDFGQPHCPQGPCYLYWNVNNSTPVTFLECTFRCSDGGAFNGSWIDGGGNTWTSESCEPTTGSCCISENGMPIACIAGRYRSECGAAEGDWSGNATCGPAWCDACPGDVNSDGTVDAADLGSILALWGTNGKSSPRADANQDGVVDAADLGLLLGYWGDCR